uniref:HTH psq-type domain-containing protein n=1 Tax=Globisporangium ultimum (strain ATCC 200006 / CBS 805.95 / DAOM BR144) TaxID=431595 RepID=K3X829_GLOUD
MALSQAPPASQEEPPQAIAAGATARMGDVPSSEDESMQSSRKDSAFAHVVAASMPLSSTVETPPRSSSSSSLTTINSREHSQRSHPYRRQQRYLSDDDRVDIIHRVQAGEKQSDLAREYQVTRAAISNTFKHRNAIMRRTMQIPDWSRSFSQGAEGSASMRDSDWRSQPGSSSNNRSARSGESTVFSLSSLHSNRTNASSEESKESSSGSTSVPRNLGGFPIQQLSR